MQSDEHTVNLHKSDQMICCKIDLFQGPETNTQGDTSADEAPTISV